MPASLHECPFCTTDRHSKPITAALHKCSQCHIVYNAEHREQVYEDTYFLDEYRSLYGKTYLEDYDTIYGLAEKRLGTILRILPEGYSRREFSVLDIGSAMGFFLKCARDAGIADVTGIEISRYAGEYTQKTFGIPVLNEPFHHDIPDRTYTVITAWYFIEHLPDPRTALKTIFKHLNEGGVFACAVPSLGPLYHCSRSEWIAWHPDDHRTDYTPRGIKKILHEIGFSKVRVQASGFHPERVIKKENILYPVFVPFYRLFARLSAYSDTIEVFARK